MSCCNGKRVTASGSPNLGLIPLIPFAEAATPAEIAPVTSGLGFGKAVLAGVTIWGLTRLADAVIGGRRTK